MFTHAEYVCLTRGWRRAGWRGYEVEGNDSRWRLIKDAGIFSVEESKELGDNTNPRT